MEKTLQKELVEKINNQSTDYKLLESEYGHFYIDPMPTQQMLDDFYKIQYFQDKTLINSKGMDIGIQNEKERFHHNRQYEEIITFLQEQFNQQDIEILDVGCGTGKLLTYLKEKGYTNLEGTEYDSSLNHEEINIFNGSFLEFETKKRYDFISFNNVLEHVIDPFKFIEKAKSLLKDDGYIRVQVPNDLSMTQINALKNQKDPNFYFFCPPEHLHYFNFESMQNILNSFNFKVVKKMTNWSMDLFILMGIDYSQDSSLGKLCHNYRLEFEYNMGEKQLMEYYESMAKLGIGRVAIEYAKKC